MNYIKISIIAFILTAFSSFCAYSQDDDDVIIGKDDLQKGGGHYFNYGDKDKVNIEVSLWGFVSSPGKYLIPQGTTLIDLITLAGGPSIDANLEDIRILRLRNDSTRISSNQMISINYNDLLWEDELSSNQKSNPPLNAGDIVLIRGENRYTTRENITFILSITSGLVTLAILILNIVNNQ